MDKFNELKAGVIHAAVFSVAIRTTQEVNLGELDPNAKLEDAVIADRELGNFDEAARLFYSIRAYSQDPVIRSRAHIELIQQLTNKGHLGAAWREIERSTLPAELNNTDRMRFFANLDSKKAWIYDLTLGYGESLGVLVNGLNLLEEISSQKKSPDDLILESTMRHFKGRAHFGLAKQGIYKKDNLADAAESFSKARNLDEASWNKGESNPDKVAFGYVWEARTAIAMGNLHLAEHFLEKSFDFFKAQDGISPERANSAPAYLVEGELRLKTGELEDAKYAFSEAISLHLNESYPYSRGLAHGYLGLAGVNFRALSFREGFKNLLNTWKSDPKVVIMSPFSI